MMAFYIAVNWGIFWGYILGDMPLEKFLAMALCMGAGSVLFFGANVTVATTKSAFKFKLGFMVRDNLIRLAVVLVTIAAAVIWYEDMFGVAINGKLAFTQGVSIDAFTGLLLKGAKEKGPLKGARSKLMAKYNK